MARKRSASEEAQKQHISIKNIQPITENQKKVFDYFDEGQHLVLSGSAGTGKTFVAMFLALRELIKTSNPCYNKIIIIRSAVPSRDIGFVPGTLEEKSKIYQDPYKQIVNELSGRGDSWYFLLHKEIIEFQTTSFLRGLTFSDCIIIFDEFQASTFHEASTVLTRIGENCRFILCGDINQNDLSIKKEKTGFDDIMNILNRIDSVSVVNFNHNDIVRSGFCKEFIIQKEKLGL